MVDRAAIKILIKTRPHARTYINIIIYIAPSPPTHITPLFIYLETINISGFKPEFTAFRDREFIIKIREIGVIKDLYKRQSAELRERINGAINAY